jgi:predicted GNAT family N-acyltransferase
MTHKLKIANYLDKDLEKKIDAFRNKTTKMSDRVRSKKEKSVHNDKYCSYGDIKKWILVLEKDDIIGVTAIFCREILFNNKKIYLGGIGKVRVRDDKRRMGIASAMMSEAIKQLKIVNSDIAYLCTDMQSFLVKFYEKYDFEKMNQSYTFLSKSGKRYTENEGMIAPINSKKIFEEIMEDKKAFDIGIGNW